MKILIVGAGFSGAVVAEQLSNNQGVYITVIDERDHIGGNCYTERDSESGIMVHKYGPHIFNTNDLELWEYLNRFCEMKPFVNRVKVDYEGKVYSFPINLHTINQFYNLSLNPSDAKSFINSLGDKSILSPKNFEEQALKYLGSDIYNAFFYGYTKKQWGCSPSELPASILSRLPVRFDYNDNYYSNQFQGIPKKGYTELFEKMLSHPQINLILNYKFDSSFSLFDFDHIFYTGPIDKFFNYKYGRLGYRSIYFEKNYFHGDFQGNAVINYTSDNIPFTRIHEHKHFSPWENYETSVYFKEFSKETEENDVPYYPKRLKNDLIIFQRYWDDYLLLKKFTFLGRLATYRYLDMQHVIREALDISFEFKQKYIK